MERYTTKEEKEREGFHLSSKVKEESVDFLFQAILALQDIDAVSYTHLIFPT